MRYLIAMFLFAALVSSAAGQGFTPREIAALPQPDPVPGPEFFSQPAGKKTPVDIRTPQQRWLLAAKAQRRRMRIRQQDTRFSQPDWGMIQVQTHAAAVRHSAGLP